MSLDKILIRKQGKQLAEIVQQELPLKANKSDVDTAIANMGSASPKGTYATLAALQAAFPTGATGIYVVTADGKWYYWNNSAWTIGGTYQSTVIADGAITTSKYADGSLTPVKIHTDTFTEINRRNDYAEILKQKHGQLLNKFVGNKNGTRSLASDTVDSCTIAFVDSEAGIPYPKEKILKIQRLTYANKNSIFWYKKIPFADVNSPEICGFWVRKSDMLSFFTLHTLVWFHDNVGASVLLLTPYRDSTVVIVGYKHTVTTSGITVTFEVVEEYNGWLYISQSIDKKPATATTVGFGFFAENQGVPITGKVDIIGCTQLEGYTSILPYFIYPESESEKTKTETEVSVAINTISSIARKTVNFGYNLEAPLLKYRSVLSKRALQVVKIACIGDSITEGYWSGRNDLYAYPVRLRMLMQAKYGGQDEGLVSVSDGDRWIFSGAWTNVAKGIAATQRNSSVNGAKATFTFTGVAVDIIYSKNTDGGNCVVKIDGVDKTVLNCYGVTEVLAQLQSYAGLAAGEHTLEIYAPTDGKKAYVEGAYVKTVGDTAGVRVDRRARSGSFTGDWTSTLMQDAFAAQSADLFILALGVNDCGSLRTPTQMKAGLQTIITKLKTLGSVILVPMMQANEVYDARFVNWKDYVTKYYELADENNIGLIDVYKLFGEAYQPAQTYGLFGSGSGVNEGSDSIHPSVRGQQMIADTIFKLIG